MVKNEEGGLRGMTSGRYENVGAVVAVAKVPHNIRARGLEVGGFEGALGIAAIFAIIEFRVVVICCLFCVAERGCEEGKEEGPGETPHAMHWKGNGE